MDAFGKQRGVLPRMTDMREVLVYTPGRRGRSKPAACRRRRIARSATREACPAWNGAEGKGGQMKFAVKQKIFAIADSFTIKDENGADVYVVKGKFFSIGKKLKLHDTSGNELAYIEQKFFRLLPEYEIYTSGDLRATVKKRFAFFRNDFDISASDGNYEVKGNFLGLEFTIVKEGMEVARISKKFFALSDTYGVEVLGGADPLLILSLAIVIDMVCHENHKGAH
jgi:uncharacterized protein YxjI